MTSNITLLHGDSKLALRKVADESIDSLVTDPPAGIGLLDLEWDQDFGGRDKWVRWLGDIMYECRRTLKPGAYGVVWAMPRTSHWTALALEDAGFQVRDIITHVFGTGFPKGVEIDKMINRARYHDTTQLYKVTEWIRGRRNALGLTNDDLDNASGIRGGASHWTAKPPNGKPAIPTRERWAKLKTLLGDAPSWIEDMIKPAHQIGEKSNLGANKWKGFSTALKPASEHWIIIQKPVSEHNLAANILHFGTGALNIDACRIPTTDSISSRVNLDFKVANYLSKNGDRSQRSVYLQNPLGRYPANFILTASQNDYDPIQILDKQSTTVGSKNASRFFKIFEVPFFYSPKASRKEKGHNNVHPTVKPMRLMEYLCKLVTPPGGIVLDPFMGSGTTGVAALNDGFSFVGIEKNGEYFSLAQSRISTRNQEPHASLVV